MMRKICLIILAICLIMLQGCGDVVEEPPLEREPSGEAVNGGMDRAVDVPANGEMEESGDEEEEDDADISPDLPSAAEDDEQVLQVGSAQGTITLGPFYGILPQIMWSPEGKNLAVSGYSDGFGIWILDYTGAAVRQVLQVPPQQGSDFTSLQLLGWSPEGRELYYAVDGLQTSGPYSGTAGIFVGRIVVEEGTAEEIAWLPERARGGMNQFKLTGQGTLLVHRLGELWQINMSKGEKKLLAGDIPQRNGLFQISFSPTGRYVVYQHDDGGRNGLVLLDTESGLQSVIIEDRDYHFFPVWGPTDDKLAFLTGIRQEDGYDLFLGEDGALPPATMIQIFDVVEETLTRFRVPGGKVGAPVWSDDGQRLAFLSARAVEKGSSYPGSDFRWDGLWEAVLTSNEVRLVAPMKGEWFSLAGWSPGGEDVYLFRYEADGGSSLLIVDRSRQEIKLTIQEAIDEPVLLHKGKIIVGKVLNAVERGKLYTEIYLVDTGGRTTQLTTNGGWKNGFQRWADRLVYVRGDADVGSYPLYVEIVALP